MTMPAAAATRFEIVAPASSLEYEATSTLHAVRGKTAKLSGFIEAEIDADGTLALEPAPRMHLEFALDSLASGNPLQDLQLLRTIDNARFPRVSADLKGLVPGARPGDYLASGEITFAGRARRYDGPLSIAARGERLELRGDLKLDMRDFGLQPPRLAMLSVDPLVSVRLRATAVKIPNGNG